MWLKLYELEMSAGSYIWEIYMVWNLTIRLKSIFTVGFKKFKSSWDPRSTVFCFFRFFWREVENRWLTCREKWARRNLMSGPDSTIYIQTVRSANLIQQLHTRHVAHKQRITVCFFFLLFFLLSGVAVCV